ncbi:MAG: hypothetical protein N2378_16300, partial [Chloroflexaceae bacterium]|nr:hypothetical protein [Chloroflexaceae bacterium]
VGLAHEYARADHTHGTPPLPTLDGDVQSGAVGSPPDATTDPATITTTVTAIQGTPVDPVAPEEGQALVFTEGAWRPGVVSVDLQPAASVRAERAYGLPSGVGVAVEYARADHTHGTPPAPSLAGEVTATVALQNDTVYRLNTRVARIMDRAVADPAAIPPFEGAVLKLRRNERGELFWAPASDETGGGAPRSFVVAAGAFRPDGAPLLTSFGNLVARPLSASPLVYLLIFDHFDGKPYVVTGAPIASASAPDPHVFEYLGTTTEAAERLSRDDQSVLAEEIRALRNERAVLVRVQRIAFPLATADKIELLPTTVGFTVEISRYP